MTCFGQGSPILGLQQWSDYWLKNIRYICLQQCKVTWWRHQMETFSTLRALCAGISPVTGELPSRRPVTWIFYVFFDLRLNKRLSKQSWGWWFEKPSCLLWCHGNVYRYIRTWTYSQHKTDDTWPRCQLLLSSRDGSTTTGTAVGQEVQGGSIGPQTYSGGQLGSHQSLDHLL